MRKFWGYRHTSGTHHVKSADGNFLDDVLHDARSSSFVDVMIEPFDAHDIADARAKLKKLVAEAETEA